MTTCKILSCSFNFSNDILRGRRQKGRKKEASGREKTKGEHKRKEGGGGQGLFPSFVALGAHKSSPILTPTSREQLLHAGTYYRFVKIVCFIYAIKLVI